MNFNEAAMSRSNLTSQRTLSVEEFFRIVKDGAIKAIIVTFLVMLLGNIALGIVSSIIRDQIPSMPPITSSIQLEVSTRNGFIEKLWVSSKAHGSSILFGAFFIFITGTRLAGYSDNTRMRKIAAWCLKKYRHVSNHWFGSIVGNAFYASAMVTVLAFSRFFNFDQWLIHFLLDRFRPLMEWLGQLLLGAAIMDYVNVWISWYGHNQAKFAFWALYLAAIADDMGLPNYKTIIHHLWCYFWSSTIRKNELCRSGKNE